MPKKLRLKGPILLTVLIVSALVIRLAVLSLIREACAADTSTWVQYAQQAEQLQPQATESASEQPSGPVFRRSRRPLGLPQKPVIIPHQPQSVQPPMPVQQNAAPPATATGMPLEPQRPAITTAATQVTLNFDDADVYSVIQTIFGDVLRVNYIVDPRVKGRVTFRSVSPVPRNDVLALMEVVLRLNGIGIVEEGGLYRIIPTADISKEPAPISIGRDPDKIASTGKSILQVVPVLYVSSAEVIKMITPFLSANALVVDITKSNQMIIVDTDANVKRLLRLVEVFDNDGVKQKKSQIFVYHCQNGKAKDIAATLQQVFLGAKSSGSESSSSSSVKPGATSRSALPAGSSSGFSQNQAVVGGDQLVSEMTRIFPDETINAIITLATPEDYELIKHTIQRVDIAQRQVVIEGMIAEVTLTDNLSLGVSGLLTASSGSFDMNFGLNASTLEGATATSGSGFSFVGTDSSGAVRAYITALASDSKAKVLASPHILVSDNREAKIQIGQQVPLTTSETFGSTTTEPIRTVEYKDIGVILKVKPRVNEGGLVAMEVNQEVSTYSKVTLGTVGETQLVINKTEAATNLVVQNGQTILIGGLIREDTSKSRSGIPLLGKIPLLGFLFGNTDNTKNRTELIILLTPRVMKDPAEAQRATSDYVERMTESSQGRIQKNDLIKKQLLEPQSPRP